MNGRRYHTESAMAATATPPSWTAHGGNPPKPERPTVPRRMIACPGHGFGLSHWGSSPAGPAARTIRWPAPRSGAPGGRGGVPGRGRGGNLRGTRRLWGGCPSGVPRYGHVVPVPVVLPACASRFCRSRSRPLSRGPPGVGEWSGTAPADPRRGSSQASGATAAAEGPTVAARHKRGLCLRCVGARQRFVRGGECGIGSRVLAWRLHGLRLNG